MVPVFQDDTLDIPASFQLFAGDIGFHIIIEGIPQIAGETYLCNLRYTFLAGTDWGILISENTEESCLVDQINGLNERNGSKNTRVFPNPFKQYTTIELENYSNKPYNCILYDLIGNEVKSINDISSNKFMIDNEGLPTGTYIFQLQNKY